jgi:hypothetical protein
MEVDSQPKAELKIKGSASASKGNNLVKHKPLAERLAEEEVSL